MTQWFESSLYNSNEYRGSYTQVQDQWQQHQQKKQKDTYMRMCPSPASSFSFIFLHTIAQSHTGCTLAKNNRKNTGESTHTTSTSPLARSFVQTCNHCQGPTSARERACATLPWWSVHWHGIVASAYQERTPLRINHPPCGWFAFDIYQHHHPLYARCALWSWVRTKSLTVSLTRSSLRGRRYTAVSKGAAVMGSSVLPRLNRRAARGGRAAPVCGRLRLVTVCWVSAAAALWLVCNAWRALFLHPSFHWSRSIATGGCRNQPWGGVRIHSEGLG